MRPPIRFSKHAARRWEERVGSPLPTPAELERILGESVRLQRFRFHYTPRGVRVKVLSVYMHKKLSVAIKIDEAWRKVVTVV